MGRKKKTTQGRRKIAIKKIASEEARHVCFSKRRNGVFTKATDLATLCGAEVAVVVDSPAGNPYSFGSPGVAEVTDRFLTGRLVSSSASSSLHSGHRTNLIRDLNMQCMELSRRVDMANAKKAMLEARLEHLMQKNTICKLAEEMEGLGLPELNAVEESLKGVKARAEGRICELMRGGGASSSNASMVAFGNGHACWAPNNLGNYGRGFY